MNNNLKKSVLLLFLIVFLINVIDVIYVGIRDVKVNWKDLILALLILPGLIIYYRDTRVNKNTKKN